MVVLGSPIVMVWLYGVVFDIRDFVSPRGGDS
jgi:hypothetical protein